MANRESSGEPPFETVDPRELTLRPTAQEDPQADPATDPRPSGPAQLLPQNPQNQLLLAQPLPIQPVAQQLPNLQQWIAHPGAANQVVFIPPPQQTRGLLSHPVTIAPLNNAHSVVAPLGMPGIFMSQPQMQQLPIRAVQIPRGCQHWAGHGGHWRENDFLDFSLTHFPGFIRVQAADRLNQYAVISRRAEDRYSRNGHRQVELTSHGVFHAPTFYLPLGMLDQNNQGIARRAYDFHLKTLVNGNRFYFYDAKDLCLFLIHLPADAVKLLRSIFVEFLTDDDEDGQNWLNQAVHILRMCSLEEFYFGYCSNCNEARCKDDKWRYLMELRGVQRVFRLMRPASRNCRECRIRGDVLFTPWNSNATYDPSRPRHYLSFSKWLNRHEDLVDALYRPE